MANSGQVTTGNAPRLIQLGIDDILEHFMKDYKGVGDMIFKSSQHGKAFVEAVQMAGMGLASIKGEGSPVEMDSVDQDWVFRWPVITYGKGCRITMEAIEDNLYQDLIPVYGQQIANSLVLTKDHLRANIFNSLSSTTGPDGQYYADTDHPLQAGGTTSNLLSPALSLGEDAIEAMVLLADNLKNPNGQISDINTRELIVPQALRFQADRIVNSKYRVDVADNTISAIYNQGVISKVITWKRLSSSTAFFLLTDAMKGFQTKVKRGVKTKQFEEPTTLSVITVATERYVNFLEDFRAVIYNAGA